MADERRCTPVYDDILIPTDGTRGSEFAIDHAVDLAAVHGARLHALYVIDEDVYSSYGGDEYVHDSEGLEAALEHEGEDALARVAERAADENVECVSTLTRGVPHEEILEYAADEDIDVVVLGTEERTGEYRRLLGSVTERVARRTSRPVSVVKTPERDE